MAALGFALLAISALAQRPTVEGNLTGPPKLGDNTFELRLRDRLGEPVTGVKVTIRVFTDSSAKVSAPVHEGKLGTYSATVNFAKAGHWKVEVSFQAGGEQTTTQMFEFVVTARDSK